MTQVGRPLETVRDAQAMTEARLQRAVDRVLADRTAIVIAHRLSTIRKADRILVFHKGRIVERGTHEELLREGKVYARLHHIQLARGNGEESCPEAVSPVAETPADRL